MTKEQTQEEIRSDFKKKVRPFRNRAYTEDTADLIADYWLSVIAQRDAERDRELLERMEKLPDEMLTAPLNFNREFRQGIRQGYKSAFSNISSWLKGRDK